MSCSFDYRQCRVVSNLDELASRRLVDGVFEGELPREKVFRDNWRTLSARVRFLDESLLLKVPRARNGRRWERFLTRFRESDALRTFRHIEQLSGMGFGAPDPVLACEYRHKGVVVDSFVCYRFVEGRPAGPQDASKILATLRALHERGYLRSDAQLANFLIVEESVTFIDFRLKKPRFLPRLQKAREIDRFLRSCPEARGFLSREEISSFWLRLASGLEAASFSLRSLKRRIRERRKATR
ncbi:hypothetical protein ACQUWM_18280 [Marinobacter sp. DUT-3]|uniref:hypothetical protein n=1 Tax=unclassified Marinobacter TaxID=83889 RepID=UPI00387AC6B9